MDSKPDQFFIDKSIQGDTRAYGVLVQKYEAYIFTVVFRMLKVREEAEEIAQDTFIKAYEALPTFRGESKFSTWLYRIAYRKSLDSLRKNKRAIHCELLEEMTEDPAHLQNAMEGMLEEERSNIIKKCIFLLPVQEAAIISMFYFEEQSIKDIALITGLSEDNVKVKLFRSRKLLFSSLEHYMVPEKKLRNGKEI